MKYQQGAMIKWINQHTYDVRRVGIDCSSGVTYDIRASSTYGTTYNTGHGRESLAYGSSETTYDMISAYCSDMRRVKASSSGATYDVRCIRVTLLIYDVKCVKVSSDARC